MRTTLEFSTLVIPRIAGGSYSMHWPRSRHSVDEGEEMTRSGAIRDMAEALNATQPFSSCKITLRAPDLGPLASMLVQAEPKRESRVKKELLLQLMRLLVATKWYGIHHHRRESCVCESNLKDISADETSAIDVEANRLLESCKASQTLNWGEFKAVVATAPVTIAISYLSPTLMIASSISSRDYRRWSTQLLHLTRSRLCGSKIVPLIMLPVTAQSLVSAGSFWD